MATIVSTRIIALRSETPRYVEVEIGLGQVVDYQAVVNKPNLGALSTKDKIDLVNDVIGQLSAGNVTGLGALAQLDRINLATHTTGTLNANTQVTNLGSLAFANSIAADNIGAGQLAAGVIYTGTINAGQLNAGTGTITRSLASTNFSLGSAGWSLDASTGAAAFASVTVRLTLTVVAHMAGQLPIQARQSLQVWLSVVSLMLPQYL